MNEQRKSETSKLDAAVTPASEGQAAVVRRIRLSRKRQAVIQPSPAPVSLRLVTVDGRVVVELIGAAGVYTSTIPLDSPPPG